MHNKSYYTGDASNELHSWYYPGKWSLTALVQQKEIIKLQELSGFYILLFLYW